ncbi:MAG TPA: hypothetical protein VN524_10880 [Hyphomicrobiaceae bacterium]|nr:hypothetical protein [Hyphomicrobiaceae bacterium]
MTTACPICGRLGGQRCRGRCLTCYVYYWRHGTDRSVAVQQRRFPRPCRGCRRLKPPSSGGHGYCAACYMAHRRAGVPMTRGA